MDKTILIIYGLILLILIGWGVFLEWRLKTVRNKLAQASVKNEDAKIIDDVHSLSSDELTALLGKDLGSGTETK